MFCKNCGAKLEDSARFCTACGTPIGPAGTDLTSQADETTVLSEKAAIARSSSETTTVVAGGAGVTQSKAGTDTDETTMLIDAEREKGAEKTSVIGQAAAPVRDSSPVRPDYVPQPPEDSVDMSHAFDPSSTPAATPSQTAQMPSVQSAPKNYVAVPEEVVGRNPAKKGKTGLIIGIICAVLVLAACGVAAAVYVVPSLTAPQTYTVNFETGGGSIVEAAEVEKGQSVNTPVDPTRDGYSFGGWYLDSGFSKAVTFPYTPESNVTIYAKWTALADGTTSTADPTGTTASTDEEALAMLKGYYAELKQGDEIVHDYAENSFNKSYNQGASKVSESLTACDEAREKVEDLLIDASTYQWKVSTMTLPNSYNDIRSELEEASDTLETRLTAYRSALQTIQGMNNPSEAAIDAAIESYLERGHEAYEDYKDITEDLDEDLR